jgi:hypothetical protein
MECIKDMAEKKLKTQDPVEDTDEKRLLYIKWEKPLKEKDKV